MADMDKLLKKIEKTADEYYDNGYNEGYKVGMEDGREEGFAEGVEAQKQAIQRRLKASEELALSAGRGAEAVRMRDMAEFLAWEYDPVAAEAEYAQRDKDWAY